MDYTKTSPAQAANFLAEYYDAAEMETPIRDAIMHFVGIEVARKQKQLAGITEELKNLRARVAHQRKQLEKQGRLIGWYRDAVDAQQSIENEYKKAMASLVNQIVLSSPLDDHGHDLKRNAAFIEAKTLVDRDSIHFPFCLLLRQPFDIGEESIREMERQGREEQAGKTEDQKALESLTRKLSDIAQKQIAMLKEMTPEERARFARAYSADGAWSRRSITTFAPSGLPRSVVDAEHQGIGEVPHA